MERAGRNWRRWRGLALADEAAGSERDKHRQCVAQLMQVSAAGLTPICLEDTDHFQLLNEFCQRPHRWVSEQLDS